MSTIFQESNESSEFESMKTGSYCHEICSVCSVNWVPTQNEGNYSGLMAVCYECKDKNSLPETDILGEILSHCISRTYSNDTRGDEGCCETRPTSSSELHITDSLTSRFNCLNTWSMSTTNNIHDICTTQNTDTLFCTDSSLAINSNYVKYANGTTSEVVTAQRIKNESTFEIYDDPFDNNIKNYHTSKIIAEVPAVILKYFTPDLILSRIDSSCNTRKPCLHQCCVCPKIFRQVAAQDRHERTHTDGKDVAFIESCGAGLQAAVSQHTTESQPGCDTEGNKLGDSGSRERHQQTHANKRSYACQKCGMRYSSRSSLRSHMSHIHNKHHTDNVHSAAIKNESTFKIYDDPFNDNTRNCNTSQVDGKYFTTDLILIRCDDSYNVGKPCSHQCRICPKIFQRASAVARHERIHTDRKQVVFTQSCSDRDVDDREDSAIGCHGVNESCKMITFDECSIISDSSNIKDGVKSMKQQTTGDSYISVSGQFCNTNDHHSLLQPQTLPQTVDHRTVSVPRAIEPHNVTAAETVAWPNIIESPIIVEENGVVNQTVDQLNGNGQRIMARPIVIEPQFVTEGNVSSSDTVTQQTASYMSHDGVGIGQAGSPQFVYIIEPQQMVSAPHAVRQCIPVAHEPVEHCRVNTYPSVSQLSTGGHFDLLQRTLFHYQVATQQIIASEDRSITSQTVPSPHASVQHDSPSANLQRASPHASGQRASLHASVQRTSPHANVQRASLHASVQRTSPHASVQHTSPRVNVQRASPHASVQRASPHASVQRASPHASVLHTSPHARVQRTTPHASVQRASPHASVQRTTPHASVQRTTTHASVQRTSPHASVQRTRSLRVASRHFCSICLQQFLEKFEYEEHLKLHRPESSLKCGICQKTCNTEALLQEHYRFEHYDISCELFICTCCSFTTKGVTSFVNHVRMHTGEKPYACPQCGKRCTSRQRLVEHVKAAHELRKDYTCPHCSDSYARLEAFKLHLQTHTALLIYACSMCDKRYSKRKSLWSHIKSKHNKRGTINVDIQAAVSQTMAQLQPAISSDTEVISGDAEVIGNNTKVIDSVMEVIERDAEMIGRDEVIGCDEEVNKLKDSVSRELQQQIHTAVRTYEGQKCDMRNSFQSSLSLHFASRYVCSICLLQFKDKLECEEHQKLHGPESILKCGICQKTCNTRALLQQHYRIKHRDRSSLLFICTFCPYTSKRVESFVNHVRLHTGEKPYVCPQCEKRCISRQRLVEHVGVAHQRRKFTQLEGFKLHLQTYTEVIDSDTEVIGNDTEMFGSDADVIGNNTK